MHVPPLHILLVEDHSALAANIIDYLEAQACQVDYAHDGRQGLALALSGAYQVLILDVQLPGLDGWQLCQALRAREGRRLPVLMLTARDTLEDKLQGFALGADDYLCKPFALEELWARCQALGRRPALHLDAHLRLGPLHLDTRSRTADCHGQALRLSPKGYELLLCLVQAHPAVVTRSEMLRCLWGDQPPDSDVLRSHIYALRKLLEAAGAAELLCTVHSVGLRLQVKA